MAETVDDRADRREEIKLRLEYLKVAGSFAVLIALVFAALQWRIANKAAEFANQIATENAYGRIANEWRDHIKSFVEKPHLRPYFEEMKQLSAEDPNRQAVLAIADVRLDVMDAILTYAAMRDPSGQIAGWKGTFARAFKAGPVLCLRWRETRADYGLITPVASSVCVCAKKT
jgi:hypothetical protein